MNHFAAWGEPCSTKQKHVRCEDCGEHCNPADHNHLHPEIVKCEGRIKISFYPRRLSTLYYSSTGLCTFRLQHCLSSPHSLTATTGQLSPAPVLSSALSALYSLVSIPSSRQNIDKANYMLQLPGAGRGGAGWLRTGRDVRMTIASHSGSILCPPARHQLSRPSLLLFKSETLNCS